MVEGKTVTTDHPVAYVSGLFRGSHLNWAALTKEAFAIYMSVKKLSFYLTDADILLKSDHLPLKKFLQKNTLNNKVNNWAMELEAFNIRFKHVSGKANILADMLRHLVDIDPLMPGLTLRMPDGNWGITYLSHCQSCPVRILFKYVKFFQEKMQLDLTLYTAVEIPTHFGPVTCPASPRQQMNHVNKDAGKRQTGPCSLQPTGRHTI